MADHPRDLVNPPAAEAQIPGADLSLDEQRLLLAIFEAIDADRRPTVDALVEGANVDRKTAGRLMSALSDKGYLTLTPTPAGTDLYHAVAGLLVPHLTR